MKKNKEFVKKKQELRERSKKYKSIGNGCPGKKRKKGRRKKEKDEKIKIERKKE